MTSHHKCSLGFDGDLLEMLVHFCGVDDTEQAPTWEYSITSLWMHLEILHRLMTKPVMSRSGLNVDFVRNSLIWNEYSPYEHEV
jgi:hypothetical protein